MKPILIFTAGLFVAGLSASPGFAQGKVAPAPKPAKRDAITPTEKPVIVYPARPTNEDPAETPAVAPTPDQVVQPIPRDERGSDHQPIPPDRPQNLQGNQDPPVDVTRPLEAPDNPSIDRLYQDRMDVDQFVPQTPQNPSLAPPPGNMQPELAPNRPGTIGGTGNQGNVGGAPNQSRNVKP